MWQACTNACRVSSCRSHYSSNIERGGNSKSVVCASRLRAYRQNAIAHFQNSPAVRYPALSSRLGTRCRLLSRVSGHTTGSPLNSHHARGDPDAGTGTDRLPAERPDVTGGGRQLSLLQWRHSGPRSADSRPASAVARCRTEWAWDNQDWNGIFFFKNIV